MKVVFCSNYMNHHQLYFSLALINQGIDYHFIASECISEERLKLGYEDMNKKYDWIIRSYESEKENKKAKKIINEADLVIAGSYPMRDIRNRIIKNKPVFLYRERLYRNSNGDSKEFYNVHNLISNLLHRYYFNFFKVYQLCASAYLPYDLSQFNILRGKYFKWGYFPEIKKYNIQELIDLKNSNEKVIISWVGRFIECKHTEYVIELAQYLKDKGYNNVEIQMIGDGKYFEKINNQIIENGLNSYIKLLGSMTPDKVRTYMEKSNIFIFTSDFIEGWGVVLNEAMNSACAVVASHAIGSVPFLIDDKRNGYMYTYGNKTEFFSLVEDLINDKEKREEFGKEAYMTILNEWNPDNAAKKVIMLYRKVILKENIKIESGVCSNANVLDNYWRK